MERNDVIFQDLPPPPIIEEAPTEADDRIVMYHERSSESIVITASREQQEIEDSSKPVSILRPETVERLGEERAVGLLRLLPSTAIAETGPKGTQAQLRIRGAEANHSLLFIDGIKANDPAAGNEARFELTSDGLFDFVELTRGPQSAIWGSEALGGVVALRSLPAGRQERLRASAEYGSFDSVRANARLDVGRSDTGLVAAISGQRSDGIDSFGADGEKDGFESLTGRISGRVALANNIGLSLSGFAIDANSQFDGFDALTFLRADTSDESDYRLGAGRLALDIAASDALKFTLGAGLLASENINSQNDAEINRTSAERYNLDGQASYDFKSESLTHRLTVAVDHEAEDFRADDILYGGFTEQQRERSRTGFTAEWVAEHRNGGGLQIALRHDAFNAFANSTSFSAGGLLPIGEHLSLVANYGEGIAQPSFYDLYGFFPGSFVGNPDLQPETSSGYDVGLRFAKNNYSASIVWFQQDLKNEIVDIFDFATFTSTTANGDGASQRSGIELEAGWWASDSFRLSANYSYLDAEGPEVAPGTRLRETRRPKHRASVFATGDSGRISYGASLAIVGARFDDDFDQFPAARVKLDAYAIASARLAYAISDEIEVYARGTNLLDADYQDVVGYETQGRAVFVGIRFAH